MTETVRLRNFRGLDTDTSSCTSTSDMELNQYVRVVTRGLFVAPAYDHAIVQYCRARFDDAKIDKKDIYRHEICSALRGTTAFVVLWLVFLDSDRFREMYRTDTGHEPPSIRDRNTEPTPNVYADFARELKAPTLQEMHHKNITDALRQQTRKILLKAKEVDLVKYKKIKKNRVQVFGTKHLYKFFTECLAEKMDQK